jgi:molybdopterin-guanine dinucleotide biosynthesis protein A
MSAASVVGLVLAGGRSARFGGEKAVALLDGRPLLLKAVDRLRSACGSVAVSARPGSQAAAVADANSLPIVGDAAEDPRGPLAGIKAGLVWAERCGAAVLAVSPCDAPLLPADLYERLLAAAGAGGAALAETRSGRQPLCSLWPVAALPAVRAALASGAHPPIWQLLEQLGARRVPFEDAEAFANVNTREALEALQARPRG